MKRKKWVRPDKPWSTDELVNLCIPIDPKRREQFAKLYHQKTGHVFDESMPLAHALMLISGSHKPRQATEIAIRYLLFGVPSFPHHDKIALNQNERELVRRRFALEEAVQYLARYESGLNAWQFVQLANSLAAAKAVIRQQANVKTLERTKQRETKIV
jgi:hypothetical protein